MRISKRIAVVGAFFAYLVVLAALLSLLACAAKIGPGASGWASWDVCGFEGGVSAQLRVMGIAASLGCTASLPPPEPPPLPPLEDPNAQ